MDWRLKAGIQNICAVLPTSLSNQLYYWMQRHFGSLRRITPISSFCIGLKVYDLIKKVGGSLVNSHVFEIGTGPRINVPLSLYLFGASRITTVDIYPYLKEELVREDFDYVTKNIGEIEKLFNKRIYKDRLNKILDFVSNSYKISNLLEFCRIQYIAPMDASETKIASNSYDYYISNAVFEHVYENNLRVILKEGNRLLKKAGIHVHRIDFKDHFSVFDKSISPIHFLQFNSREWDKIVRNKYMYMNRLRIDDFCVLFKKMGHRILLVDSDLDTKVLENLRLGKFDLGKQFSKKSKQILATTMSWIVAKNASNNLEDF